MMNNLLGVIVVGGLVGTFVLAPTPETAPRSVASRPASTDVAAASPADVASNTLTSQHPPVPLVRSPRALPATAVSPEVRANPVDANQLDVQPQDRSDRTAARAAIEADGYKGVTVLGKGTDGTWRAKAYRGKTEVQLTVDGTGRVSTE